MAKIVIDEPHYFGTTAATSLLAAVALSRRYLDNQVVKTNQILRNF